VIWRHCGQITSRTEVIWSHCGHITSRTEVVWSHCATLPAELKWYGDTVATLPADYTSSINTDHADVTILTYILMILCHILHGIPNDRFPSSVTIACLKQFLFHHQRSMANSPSDFHFSEQAQIFSSETLRCDSRRPSHWRVVKQMLNLSIHR
jgi:hypothetical protein